MEIFDPPARLFKLLGHPARLAILDALREGEHCVCHLEAVLGLRQAYLSQQLMLLREAGLVKDRRDGQNIFYHVAEPRVFSVIDAALPDAPRRKARAGRPACSCPKCQPTVPAPVLAGATLST